MNSSHVNLAIGLMLMVACLQSSASFLVKGIDGNVTIGIEVLSYYIIPLFFFLPILLKDGFIYYKTKNFLFYLTRGVFSVASVFCFFYASQNIGLGVSSLLFNTVPVFIPLLSPIFLKEKTSRQACVGIFISAVGVVTILHPHFKAFLSWPVLVGLASGFLMAVSQIMLRGAVKKNEPINKIVFYQYLTCTIVAIFIIVIEATYQHNLDVVKIFNFQKIYFILGALFSLGFLCLIGQFILSKAFQYMPASKLAPFLYVSVPISSFIGWLVWDQIFTGMMWLGTGLIVLGVLIITFDVRLNSLCNYQMNSKPII